VFPTSLALVVFANTAKHSAARRGLQTLSRDYRHRDKREKKRDREGRKHPWKLLKFNKWRDMKHRETNGRAGRRERLNPLLVSLVGFPTGRRCKSNDFRMNVTYGRYENLTKPPGGNFGGRLQRDAARENITATAYRDNNALQRMQPGARSWKLFGL